MINGDLFIPTKHFHNNSEHHADWDHSIYVLNGNVQLKNTINGISVKDSNGYNTSPPKLPVKMITNDMSELKRIDIKSGYKANHDFIIEAR